MHIVSQNAGADGRGYLLASQRHRASSLGMELQNRTHIRSSSGDSNRKSWLFGSHGIIPVSQNNDTESEEMELMGDLEDLTQNFQCTKELYDGHDCDLEGCKRVVLNISGLKFETQMRTLNRLPNTLMGNEQKRKKYWDPQRKEYFFDRHRPSFPAILYFYQSGGRLKRPLEVPSDIFLSELQFFELGKSVLAAYKLSEGYLLGDETPPMPDNPMQRKIWELFEYPDSSIAARVLAVFSVIFILISVTVFCVETLPYFKGSDCIKRKFSISENSTTTVSKMNFEHPLFILESCCITWFVIELGVRFITSPIKTVFFKDVINWIDFVAIFPYFVSLLMYTITGECGGSSGAALSVLRVLRVTRILKLSKHSEGLQLLGKTMQSSFSELLMFALFLGIGIVIFSGAIYYAELPQTY